MSSKAPEGGRPGTRIPSISTAYGLSLGAMITIQAGNAIAVGLIDRIGVLSAVSLRLLFGSLLVTIIVRPALRLRDWAGIRLVLTFGFVIAVMSGTIYGALSHLPLGISVTISLLGPLTVSALGSRRRLDLLWPAIAIVGVILIANSHESSGPSISVLGIAFALANAAAWGTYIVMSSRAGRHFDGVQGLALASAVAALLWLPVGVADGGASLLALSVLLLGLLTGILTTGLPYTMENLALRRLPTRIFGTLASLEPAIATFIGLVFLGQVPGLLAYAGILLVTGASFGVSLPVQPSPVSAP
jgi:inner membrane transporter RhtA